MKASTEEFLYILLWTADSIARPTWRNLNDGFESWAWRSGLGRRLAELEKQKLLERSPDPATNAIVRLTQAGVRAALGGRNPAEQWGRSWDGRWRLVLFDVPEKHRALRIRLWRYLRHEGFGFLQNSAWITPDALDTVRSAIAKDVTNVESLVLIEGRPCGGESNEDIVRGGWDFAQINAQYENCLAILKCPPKPGEPSRLRDWIRQERRTWNNAIRSDPLLPRALLPRNYLGEKTWEVRHRIMGRLAPDITL